MMMKMALDSAKAIIPEIEETINRLERKLKVHQNGATEDELKHWKKVMGAIKKVNTAWGPLKVYYARQMVKTARKIRERYPGS